MHFFNNLIKMHQILRFFAFFLRFLLNFALCKRARSAPQKRQLLRILPRGKRLAKGALEPSAVFADEALFVELDVGFGFLRHMS